MQRKQEKSKEVTCSLSREIIRFELPEAILIFAQNITWILQMTFIVHDDKSHHHQNRHHVYISYVLFQAFFTLHFVCMYMCNVYEFSLFILELNGNPSFDVSISIFFSMKFNHNERRIPYYFIYLIQAYSSFQNNNTHTCILSSVWCEMLLVASSSSACQFYVRVIWYRLRTIIISYLIHRNWKCWLCCVVLCFGVMCVVCSTV